MKEKTYKFKMFFKMGDEITTKGKDKEDAEINALTEISFNPHDWIGLE